MTEKGGDAGSARTVVDGNCITSTSSQLKNRLLLLSSLPTNVVCPYSEDKTRSTLPPSSIFVDLPTFPKKKQCGGLTAISES
eukprot:CAMPEP_0204250752 /NCGR_PEP_ID=MMETSP0361-20130328/100322_1 /ASSEMBLY_ACC=CAM_ASM_000343 /TAXON_ID=268821 /ORGANISM="Scrippsiella Hangoei, Strain SHTV-5" /LENGTH=81 /DNA_ID=CAMNT_0051224021 /DNA_START=154 /DNA_END=399 /DNA_ORIENTATION=+